MNVRIPVSSTILAGLNNLDTCTTSNAIERLNVRLRNEGFISHAVQCRFPQFKPMLGFAATSRIRTSSTPMSGHWYYDRMDWWNYLASIPEPRVMVIQDSDHTPGVGALIGEIHATIAQALNGVGCVTNGAVRDLAALESLGFHAFSGSVAVSHAYAHIVDFDCSVEVGGLKIQSGDLLHGDRNGVHVIPLAIADEVPRIAHQIADEERDLIRFCRSQEFSLEALSVRLREPCRDGGPSRKSEKA